MTTASEDLESQCKHEITRRFCSMCNGFEDLQRREHDLKVETILKIPGWKASNYGGRCARCRGRYHPGTPIRKKTNLDHCPPDSPNWVAMCCAAED
jgi:hypothetical protein